MIDRKDIAERLRGNVDMVIKRINHMSDEQLEKATDGDFDNWMEDQISALCDWEEDTCSVLDRWAGADGCYKSGTEPKYAKDQQIQFYSDRVWWWGYIEHVGGKTGGLMNNEFSYDIRRGNSIYFGICESKIKVY